MHALAKATVLGIGVMTLGLAAGCMPLRPPVRTSGQAESRDGVSLAVVRQSCFQTTEPEQHGFDLVEERIELRVHNGSPDLATLDRGAFRLLTPDGSALKTVTWFAARPLAIAGGTDSTFELRFMARGVLACTQEMRLASNDALELRARPVALQAIAFVPERAL
jgi:hypothetical protein